MTYCIEVVIPKGGEHDENGLKAQNSPDRHIFYQLQLGYYMYYIVYINSSFIDCPWNHL